MGASAVTCKLLPHWLKPVPRFGGLNAGALSRSLRQSSSVPLDPSNRSTLEEGLIFKSSRAFSAADVQTFANVSGDHNPVHLDEDFAAQTVFKRTIVHGILTASMFSALFATHLPGSIYLSQQLKFIAPVRSNAGKLSGVKCFIAAQTD
eukprot:SAG31_NODE_932_length_10913_cov_3.933235_12_plen_149_part_00